MTYLYKWVAEELLLHYLHTKKCASGGLGQRRRRRRKTSLSLLKALNNEQTCFPTDPKSSFLAFLAKGTTTTAVTASRVKEASERASETAFSTRLQPARPCKHVRARSQPAWFILWLLMLLDQVFWYIHTNYYWTYILYFCTSTVLSMEFPGSDRALIERRGGTTGKAYSSSLSFCIRRRKKALFLQSPIIQ